ncbi:MAG: hypothetical protein HFE63_10980 [Clostridiales bacterium]|nr:hypothetical protein [Clostridiales bacterium]
MTDIEKEQLSEHEKDLQMIADFCLMDDDFMSEVFDNNIKAVEVVLSIILERDDLRVLSAETQSEYKSTAMRSVTLDIRAVDDEGKIYDIEIQRSDHGAGVRRARYHSSMIDRTLLEKGENFDSLVDTYVIFITERDKYGKGIPMYHIERKISELDDELFGDGTHIIYVNGEYRDTGNPVGRLMHDFQCKCAGDMLLPELAERVKYYKETEGGTNQMCRAMEARVEERLQKRLQEKIEKRNIEVALSMLDDGRFTFEDIAKFSQLSLEDVKELAKKHSA